jgi:hypothetical protein
MGTSYHEIRERSEKREKETPRGQVSRVRVRFLPDLSDLPDSSDKSDKSDTFVITRVRSAICRERVRQGAQTGRVLF